MFFNSGYLFFFKFFFVDCHAEEHGGSGGAKTRTKDVQDEVFGNAVNRGQCNADSGVKGSTGNTTNSNRTDRHRHTNGQSEKRILFLGFGGGHIQDDNRQGKCKHGFADECRAKWCR